MSNTIDWGSLYSQLRQKVPVTDLAERFYPHGEWRNHFYYFPCPNPDHANDKRLGNCYATPIGYSRFPNRFHCLACQFGGCALDLYMLNKGYSKSESPKAALELAQEYGIIALEKEKSSFSYADYKFLGFDEWWYENLRKDNPSLFKECIEKRVIQIIRVSTFTLAQQIVEDQIIDKKQSVVEDIYRVSDLIEKHRLDIPAKYMERLSYVKTYL